MYWQTLYPNTKKLLYEMVKIPALQEFTLVGGTALALQIGHRRSIDLDFFTPNQVNYERLLEELNQSLEVTVIQQWKTGLLLNIQGVKCDILHHNYPWLIAPKKMAEIPLASKADIAAMKVNAICGRGSKKDFYDLCYLLQEFTLKEIINFFEKKYANYSKLMVYKSLIYFNDAEEEPEPEVLTSLSWEEVKSTITNALDQLEI